MISFYTVAKGCYNNSSCTLIVCKLVKLKLVMFLLFVHVCIHCLTKGCTKYTIILLLTKKKMHISVRSVSSVDVTINGPWNYNLGRN